MECPGDRCRPRWRLWWTDPFENLANVLAQKAVPRCADCQVIALVGEERRFRYAAENLRRPLAGAYPGRRLPEPRCQRSVMRPDGVAYRRWQLVPDRVCAQVEDH